MLVVGASEQIGHAVVPAHAMEIVNRMRKTRNKEKNGCCCMSLKMHVVVVFYKVYDLFPIA